MSCGLKVRPPPGAVLKHLHFTGIRPYAQGDLIQSYIASLHAAQKRDRSLAKPSQVVVSFQFESVYTGGRREKFRTHEWLPKGVEFIQTLRGGEVTYHGPGQLVAYPVLDLSAYRLKSKCYIDMLQNSIKDTLLQHGVETIESENTGVWVDEKTKIASIGVNIQRSITSHGISLNSNPDLSYFNSSNLVICGLPQAKQTSIKQLTGKDIKIAALGEQFTQAFADRLGVQNLEHHQIDVEINADNVANVLDEILL